MQREKMSKPRIKLKNTVCVWLKAKGWTQKRLALVLGVNAATLSLVIAGKSQPTWPLLRKLHVLTGFDLGDLACFETEPEENITQ